MGTVCFHGQKCAEKYLKALLAFHSVPFPKIHDLHELLHLTRTTVELNLDLGELSILNRYSVEARYPGEWEPVTRTDAQEAVSIARQIRDVARSHLPESFFG